MLWLLISISILRRKTALTVSLSLTWISNIAFTPSPPGELWQSLFFLTKHVSAMTVFNIYLFIYLFVACIISLTWPTSLTLLLLILYRGWGLPGRWQSFSDTTAPDLLCPVVSLTSSSSTVSSKSGWRVARTAANASPPLHVCDVCFPECPRQLELSVSLQHYSRVDMKTDLSSEKMEKEDSYCSVTHPVGMVRVSGRIRGRGRVRASKIPLQSIKFC